MRKNLLGHGGFGMVWLEHRADGDQTGTMPKVRAVKQIRKDDSVSAGGKYARELDILVKFSQEKVHTVQTRVESVANDATKYQDSFFKLYGWFESPQSEWLYIAMEFCEFGDLRKYLGENGGLPEAQVQDIAAQIVHGLRSMHENCIAHRDLKPANILIKSRPPGEWWVKICDLGLSKRIREESGSFGLGTLDFMPPELIWSEKPNPDPFAADMWSLGATIFNIFTAHPAFGNQSKLRRYRNGRDEEFPNQELLQKKATAEFIGFLTSLMMVSPTARIRAVDAEVHAWFLQHTQHFEPGITPSEILNQPRIVSFDMQALNQSFTNITPAGQWVTPTNVPSKVPSDDIRVRSNPKQKTWSLQPPLSPNELSFITEAEYLQLREEYWERHLKSGPEPHRRAGVDEDEIRKLFDEGAKEKFNKCFREGFFGAARDGDRRKIGRRFFASVVSFTGSPMKKKRTRTEIDLLPKSENEGCVSM